MSQHIFKATSNEGEKLHIQMGFDSPMNWYYMTIFSVTGEGKAPSLKWSNLEHETPEILTLDYFERVLGKLGITVPNDIIENVEKDKQARQMNHRMDYSLA